MLREISLPLVGNMEHPDNLIIHSQWHCHYLSGAEQVDVLLNNVCISWAVVGEVGLSGGKHSYRVTSMAEPHAILVNDLWIVHSESWLLQYKLLRFRIP